MRAGFNFIETVLALLIGLVILAGLLRFVSVGTTQYLAAKTQLQRAANANMARASLAEKFRQLDPEFWDAFPAMRDPIHGSFSFFDAGKSVSESCPIRNQTCITLWDCVPTELPFPLIVADASYPQWLEVIPLEEEDPLPASTNLAQVAMILRNEEAFCLVIRAVEAGHLLLADAQDQLWDFPEFEDWSDIEIYLLGELTVEHLFLRSSPGRAMSLVAEPWVLAADGWRARRGFSSYTHFSALTFESEPPSLLLRSDEPLAEETNDIWISL